MECSPYLLETLGDEEPDTLVETTPGFLVDELDRILESLPTAPVPAVRSWPPAIMPAGPRRSRLRSALDAVKRWFARLALGAE